MANFEEFKPQATAVEAQTNTLFEETFGSPAYMSTILNATRANDANMPGLPEITLTSTEGANVANGANPAGENAQGSALRVRPAEAPPQPGSQPQAPEMFLRPASVSGPNSDRKNLALAELVRFVNQTEPGEERLSQLQDLVNPPLGEKNLALAELLRHNNEAPPDDDLVAQMEDRVNPKLEDLIVIPREGIWPANAEQPRNNSFAVARDLSQAAALVGLSPEATNELKQLGQKLEACLNGGSAEHIRLVKDAIQEFARGLTKVEVAKLTRLFGESDYVTTRHMSTIINSQRRTK
ncbi:MAG: hypothetical protein K2W95_26770 [Candidatus Obscuribacterales bacterium]|nr:hypothetical protein [Candidatus Obscuribacterales bacterium]